MMMMIGVWALYGQGRQGWVAHRKAVREAPQAGRCPAERCGGLEVGAGGQAESIHPLTVSSTSSSRPTILFLRFHG